MAINGGALIANVFISGIGGFAFWIIAARSAPPAVVAQSSAVITSMLGVQTLSQQSLVNNVPILLAGSPRPRRLVGRAYIAALCLTAVGSLLYLFVVTRIASGLHYLRDGRLAVVFFLGCVMWSIFSLQDGVLTGLRRSRLVLLENTTWTVCRILLMLALPLVGIELSILWILATWLIPATALVAVITYRLFVVPSSPLKQPLGTHDVGRRALFSFLGLEHLGSIMNGVVQIVIPAVALSALGARAAAPFLAAFSLLVVTEVALSSFSGAFSVEVRRKGFVGRNMIVLTCALLGGISLVAIVAAQFYAKDFMSLFGRVYRAPGGAALAVLVLGLPATSIRLLASQSNRLRQAGRSNLVQQLVYCAALFVAFRVAHLETGRSLAVCLVVARYVAAAACLPSLGKLRSIRSGTAASVSEASAI